MVDAVIMLPAPIYSYQDSAHATQWMVGFPFEYTSGQPLKWMAHDDNSGLWHQGLADRYISLPNTTAPAATPPGQESNCKPGEQVEYRKVPSDIFANFTCPFERIYLPPWEMGLKISFYVIAMLMAILGNTFVLFVVASNKRMHTRTNVYIANLAVSDLMVGVFNMWVHLGSHISPDWPFPSGICKLFPFFQIIALTASTGFLTVIAGERFFAIVFPMKARYSKPYKNAIIMVITWLVAITVGIPNILVRRMHVLNWADRRQVWCDEEWPRYTDGQDPTGNQVCLYVYPNRVIYYTIQVVVMYFVPVLVMTLAYTIIGCTLRKRKVPGNQTDSVIAQQQKTKKKVVKMLLVVFIVFVVCWTPQEILVLLSVHAPEVSHQVPPAVGYAAIFIAYFNSSMNPILYAWLNDNFRRGFKEAINCRLLRKNKISPVMTTDMPNFTNNTPDTAQTSPTQKNGDFTFDGRMTGVLQRHLVTNGRPRLPTIREDPHNGAHHAEDSDKGLVAMKSREERPAKHSPLVLDQLISEALTVDSNEIKMHQQQDEDCNEAKVAEERYREQGGGVGSNTECAVHSTSEGTRGSQQETCDEAMTEAIENTDDEILQGKKKNSVAPSKQAWS